MQTQQTQNSLDGSAAFRRVVWSGLAVNMLLAAAKFFAGWFGQSRALLADAVHSLSDMATDVGLLAGQAWWSRPADRTHPYGHRQLENVVTIALGWILLGVAVGIGWGALRALTGAPPPQPSRWALVTAVISILLKEILYRWTLAEGRRIDSAPLVANAWHHRSDALSSIPVVLALAGTAIGPRWAFLDTLGALAVCLFLVHAAYRIAWGAVMKVLGCSARIEEEDAMLRTVLSHPRVRSAHRLRTRYLGGSRIAVDVHVLVDGALSVSDGHRISEQVTALLQDRHPRVTDVVTHLEPMEGGSISP